MSFYNHFFQKQTFYGDFLKKQRIKMELKRIKFFCDFNKKMNWLEIGPGKGDIMEHIINNYKNIEYHCIEPNKQICDYLNSICKNVKNKFVPPVPYEDNYFDIVYLSNILEHLPDFKSEIAVIKEARRVLKHRGKIIINGPDLIHWRELFWDCDYTHNFPLPKRRLETLLEDNDFEIKHFNYFAGPFSGFVATIFSCAAYFFINPLLFSYLTFKFVPSYKFYKLKLSSLRNVFFIAEKKK